MNTEFSRQVGDYLVTREAKEQRRKYIRDILIGAACGLALLIAATYPTKAHASAMLRAESGGVTVTIYDQPCALKEVSNLPKRATWTEKGKTYEGCIGAHPQFPVLMAYFTDKTVVVLPVEMFTRVQGA